MKSTLAHYYLKLKKAFPAIFFFGGFFLDVATMGQFISNLDLFLLLFYIVVAGAILLVMGRRGDPQGALPSEPGEENEHVQNIHSQKQSRFQKIKHWVRTEGLLFGLQFCYGSLFSALSIFYFLSSSYLPSFFIVIALAILLCLNEFLESHYHRFTLTWTLYGLCTILYLNFALPHLFHSIASIWFFISTALGVTLIFILKKYSTHAKGSIWPVTAVGIILVLLYLGNAIPPVPLVKKEMIICRDLVKQGTVYSARIEKPAWWFFWRKTETNARIAPGEKLFCFTSIFLPAGIDCKLYHKWMYYDDHKKSWVETSRMGFFISGGRLHGFRGYTYKQKLTPGEWQVKVETETGRVLGDIHFNVEVITDYPLEYKNLQLE